MFKWVSVSKQESKQASKQWSKQANKMITIGIRSSMQLSRAYHTGSRVQGSTLFPLQTYTYSVCLYISDLEYSFRLIINK